METLFLVALATLFIGYCCIGIFASRNITTSTDYFLAGKSLSIHTIVATLLATQVGGGMFLGTAQDPIRGLLYNGGMVLGFLVLGLGLASHLQRFKVTTVGEIFDKTYESPFLHQLTALLAAVSMCGIIISQIIAAKSVLITFAGINNEIIFLLFWALVLAYTMIGGLAAVVIADLLQIIVIVTVFTGICLYSLYTSPTPFLNHQTYTHIQNLVSYKTLSWGHAIKIFSMPVFFSIIEQDLAQRFFAAKSDRAAAVSALIASALLLVFSFVPFYLGLKAQLMNIPIPEGVNPLLPVLKAITSPMVFVFAVCALLSAITSTTDSLLCAVSATITTAATQLGTRSKPSIHISRTVTFLCGVFTLAASYFVPPNIIDVLIASYELSVACLFIPLAFCFITKDLRREAALTSALFGGLGFLFFLFKSTPLLKPYSIFITLGLSLLGYGIGFIFGSKKK